MLLLKIDGSTSIPEKLVAYKLHNSFRSWRDNEVFDGTNYWGGINTKCKAIKVIDRLTEWIFLNMYSFEVVKCVYDDDKFHKHFIYVIIIVFVY